MEKNKYCISYRIYWNKWGNRITGHTFSLTSDLINPTVLEDAIIKDIRSTYGNDIIYESYELIKIFEFKGDKVYGW